MDSEGFPKIPDLSPEKSPRGSRETPEDYRGFAEDYRGFTEDYRESPCSGKWENSGTLGKLQEFAAPTLALCS